MTKSKRSPKFRRRSHMYMGSDGDAYQVPTSCETAEQGVREIFLVNPIKWFNYEILNELLNQMSLSASKGYLYNVMSELARGKHPYVERKRCFNTVQFRLYEVGAVGRGERKSEKLSVGFRNYLVSLDWDVDTTVHNPHYWTNVGSLVFIDANWKYSKRMKKYTMKVIHDGYGFTAKAHEKAMTLEVHQKCSRRPFRSGREGLLKLYECLVSFRASHLNYLEVPYCGDWTVKTWHYGKDTKNTLTGLSFEITVHNWLGELLRLYTFSKSNTVRLEVQERLGLKWSQILGRNECWRIHQKHL